MAGSGYIAFPSTMSPVTYPRPPCSRNVAPEPTRWWSWAAAVGASFLGAGLWNLTAHGPATLPLEMQMTDTTTVVVDVEQSPREQDQPPDPADPPDLEIDPLPELEEPELPDLPEPEPVDELPEIIDPLPPPPERRPDPPPQPRSQPQPQPQPRPQPAPAPAPATQPRTMDGARGRFPQPPYPSFALSRGLSGSVVVTIDVSDDGRPSSVNVARSSGHRDLDRHVVQWIQRRWRWDAGQAGRYTQPVNFQIQR